MKPVVAAAAAMLLQSCAALQPETTQVLDLADLKASPERTLELFEGKRIRVAGYYLVSYIDSECWGVGKPIPQGRLGTFLDLTLPRQKFDGAVHRWVVLEATVRKPQSLQLGGADLVIEVGAWEQDFYLDDAKLVSVDDAKPLCR